MSESGETVIRMSRNGMDVVEIVWVKLRAGWKLDR